MRGSYVVLLLVCVITSGLEVQDEVAVSDDMDQDVKEMMKLTNKIGKTDEGSGVIVTTKSHFGVGFTQTSEPPSTTTTTTRIVKTADPNYKSTPRPTPNAAKSTVKAGYTPPTSTTKPHLTKGPGGKEGEQSASTTKDALKGEEDKNDKPPSDAGESAVSQMDEKSQQEEISEATVEQSNKWKNFGMMAVLLSGLSLMTIGCWRFKVEGDSLKESFLEEATLMDMEE